MAYTRCDKDCNPVTPQPLHTDITQIVSCLTYEVYNESYERRDVDCEIADTQPDIKNGYNGDYVRVKTDKTKVTGLSKQMVEQTLYKRVYVGSVDLSKCYNTPPLDPTFIRSVSTVGVVDYDMYLAVEQSADYYLETEDELNTISFERNTQAYTQYLTR
jgi:hypothetical protein